MEQMNFFNNINNINNNTNNNMNMMSNILQMYYMNETMYNMNKMMLNQLMQNCNNSLNSNEINNLNNNGGFNMNQMMQNQIMLNFQKMQNLQNIQKCDNPLNNNEGISVLNDYSFDPFQGNNHRRINIFFELNTGRKFRVTAPINITVYELIDGFFKKVGLLNTELQRRFNFLFNGWQLKRFINGEHNNKLITDVGLVDGFKVFVVEPQNLVP